VSGHSKGAISQEHTGKNNTHILRIFPINFDYFLKVSKYSVKQIKIDLLHLNNVEIIYKKYYDCGRNEGILCYTTTLVIFIIS